MSEWLCRRKRSDLNEELLRSVEQNDGSFMTLSLNRHDVGLDFSRLSKAIATNTNINHLEVDYYMLDITGMGLCESLKQNTSIYDLVIRGNELPLVGTVGVGILQAYQENSTNLLYLRLMNCNIHTSTNPHNEGAIEIATTLQCCTNLKMIHLVDCNIIDYQLLPMVEAMRGLHSLGQLHLNDNFIRDEGCQALATLLEDANCNIQILQLEGNEITNEGVVILINSLANNIKLRSIDLNSNPVDRNSLDTVLHGVLPGLLCNISSVDSIYSSNHTFEDLDISDVNNDTTNRWLRSQHVRSLLRMNEYIVKSHVAIKKILRYLPNIDMEPLFGLDSEAEQSLKALPFVIDWFNNKASAVVADDEDSSLSSVSDEEESYDYRIEEKKLSAIFQFARAMPLHFVPSTPDMILLHEDTRDQLEDEKTKLERQIDSMLKTKKDLEDRIKAKDETIENLRGLSDSVNNVKVDDKKRKRS